MSAAGILKSSQLKELEMSKGVPIEEYRFRSLMDHAFKFGALMGG